MWWSWVAISTVVPVRLIRSSSTMMSLLVSGSRFPVGSSASSTSGRFTNARAIATRCCSPPDSSVGSRSAFPDSPTISSTSGTMRLITSGRLPITSSANATFSETVFCCSSRKSWKTQPMTCRSFGTCRPGSLLTWNFDTCMSPLVGDSSASSSRMNVDLPEPDGPMRKTNSPLSILSETLSSAGRAEVLYSLLTWSSVIITARQCSGEAQRRPSSYRGTSGVGGHSSRYRRCRRRRRHRRCLHQRLRAERAAWAVGIDHRRRRTGRRFTRRVVGTRRRRLGRGRRRRRGGGRGHRLLGRRTCVRGTQV